jgi:hypothetical protein
MNSIGVLRTEDGGGRHVRRTLLPSKHTASAALQQGAEDGEGFGLHPAFLSSSTNQSDE